MSTSKQSYVTRIRDDSTYPLFRSSITFIVLMFYLLGGGTILIGIGFMALGANTLLHDKDVSMPVILEFAAFLTCMIAGLVSIGTGKIIGEVALILADIADSLTDMFSRYEQ